WARPTCRPPGKRSSAASGRWTRARWCWASSTATGRCPASTPSPAGTPSSPPGCGSTTPAGAACRSTCAPASGWRPPPRPSAPAQRVSLILREPPGPLAGRLPRDGNVLSFSMAGDGEIDLSLVAKKPGPALDLDVAHASIPLATLRHADPLPPYARLLHDVLL